MCDQSSVLIILCIDMIRFDDNALATILPPILIFPWHEEGEARDNALIIARASQWYDLSNDEAKRLFNNVDKTRHEPHIRDELLSQLDIVIVHQLKETPERNSPEWKLLFASARDMSKVRSSWDNPSFNTDFLIQERGFAKIHRSSLFINLPSDKSLRPMILGLFINGRTLPHLTDVVAGHSKLYENMSRCFSSSADRPGIIMAGVRVNRNQSMRLTTAQPNLVGYYSAKSPSARKDLANPASEISLGIYSSCKLQCDLEYFVSPIMGIRRRGVKLVNPGILPHISSKDVPALAMGISRGIMNPLHSDDPYAGLTETITFNTSDVPPGAQLTFCLYVCGCLLDLQSHHANLIMVQSEFAHGTPGISPLSGASSHGAIGLATHTKGTLTKNLGQLGLTTLYRRVHEDEKWRKFRGEGLFTSCSPINCLSCGEGGNSIPCGQAECVAALHQKGVEEEEEVEEDAVHKEEEEEEAPASPPPRGLALISWDLFEDGTGGVENEALLTLTDQFLPLATPREGELNQWRAVDIRGLSEGSYSYVRLHYYPRDPSAPSTSSSPSTLSTSASKTSYLNLRLMCQLRDRPSREKATRSILLRVEEPEGKAPMKKKGKGRRGHATPSCQLWWSPFHNHFFTCEEGDSLRDQIEWQEVSVDEAQSLWPETPLGQFLATGIVFFDGEKGDQLELQLEDWSNEQYKAEVVSFFGLSLDEGSGSKGQEAAAASQARRETRSRDKVSYADFMARHQSLIVGGWWPDAPAAAQVSEDAPAAAAAEDVQPSITHRAHRSTRAAAGRGLPAAPTPPIVDQLQTRSKVPALPPPSTSVREAEREGAALRRSKRKSQAEGSGVK